jgi:hypothetical protein
MTPAKLAARCHDYAAQCWLFARQQNNVTDKLALIDMAETWLALANCAKKNLLALPELPDSRQYH